MSGREIKNAVIDGTMLGREDSPAPPEPKAEAEGAYFDVLFDGPPSHESGRFVEVEDANGKSINIGEWIENEHQGWWRLRLPLSAPAAAREASSGLFINRAEIEAIEGMMEGITSRGDRDLLRGILSRAKALGIAGEEGRG